MTLKFYSQGSCNVFVLAWIGNTFPHSKYFADSYIDISFSYVSLWFTELSCLPYSAWTSKSYSRKSLTCGCSSDQSWAWNTSSRLLWVFSISDLILSTGLSFKLSQKGGKYREGTKGLKKKKKKDLEDPRYLFILRIYTCDNAPFSLLPTDTI